MMIEEIDMFDLDIDGVRDLFFSIAGLILTNYGFECIESDGYEKYIWKDMEVWIWPSFELEVIRPGKPIEKIEMVLNNWKKLRVDVEKFVNDNDGFYFIGVIPTDEYMDDVIDTIVCDIVGYVGRE